MEISIFSSYHFHPEVQYLEEIERFELMNAGDARSY